MPTRGLSLAAVFGRTLAVGFLLMMGLGLLPGQTKPATQPAPTPPASSSDSTQSPMLSRVFAAWKARQERIKSFYFVWKVHAALPKGFRFANEPGLSGLRPGNTAFDRK